VIEMIFKVDKTLEKLVLNMKKRWSKMSRHGTPVIRFLEWKTQPFGRHR
jgi:hypothetical protein